MPKAESIQKNFIYNVVYQVLLVLLPLITAPYISRTLGAEAVGIYSYTNSVAHYFLLVAMLGFSNHGNRNVAAVRDNQEKLNRTFSSIFSLQFMSFTIAIVAYIVYLLCFVDDNNIISTIQTIYVVSGLFDISWLFFGLEKFKITVTRNLLIKLATVACMFIFVHSPSDVWKYTLIICTGTFLSQLYLWFYVKKYVKFVWVGFKEIFSNLKDVLILFIPVLSYSIYKVMDKIMLGQLATYEQVGFYQNAEKITNIPMGIITALGTVMLPRMSNIIAKGNKTKSLDYIRISVKFVTLLCASITFGLMGISDVLAPVYLGADFSPCAPLISLLSVTVFFIAWANVVRTQYLIPYHYDKIYIASTIVGAVVNLIINFLLIPTYQAIGAAIGTVAAEFSVMAIQMICVRKKLPMLKYILQYTPVIIIGGVMMVAVHFVGKAVGISIFSLVIELLIGVAIFVFASAVFLWISEDELWILLKKNVEGMFKKFKAR